MPRHPSEYGVTRECADLSLDCLRATGPEQWAVHVPLGKLKTERMVPVARLFVVSASSHASFVPLIAPTRLSLGAYTS